MMVSEVVGKTGEVSFLRIVQVIRVIFLIFSAFNIVRSRHGEEVTVPRTVLVLVSFTLLLVFGIVSSHHVLMSFTSSNLHVSRLVLADHGRVRLEVRSVEPSVKFLFITDSIFGVNESNDSTGSEGPVTECKASLSGRFNVREIVNETLVRYNWYTSLVMLHSTSEEDSNGIETGSTDKPV